MELFLVTDPPLILIELLNFYGILSEGFLISVLGQGGSCKKEQTYATPFPLHKICSVSTASLFSPNSPTCIGSKKDCREGLNKIFLLPCWLVTQIFQHFLSYIDIDVLYEYVASWFLIKNKSMLWCVFEIISSLNIKGLKLGYINSSLNDANLKSSCRRGRATKNCSPENFIVSLAGSLLISFHFI